MSDGIPAFPVQVSDVAGFVYSAEDMTLRDRFAVRLMTLVFRENSAFYDDNWMAVKAYELADAMLKARTRNPK